MNNVIAKLRAKKDSKKGFTLMEMLIVVAIIAILVAVSIPVFTSQLEKAKEITDIANQRSAKALATTAYMLNEDGDGDELTYDGTGDTAAVTLYYDAENGKLVDTALTSNYYGQCSKHKDGYLEVKITKKDGTIALKWLGTNVTATVD